MITAWRERFGQGDLPFYWVQLASFKAGNGEGRDWAFLREAQTRTLSLNATGMAVTIDIGEPDDIHPKNKQDVGRRLWRVARAQTYGRGGEYSGPIFERVELAGDRLRVHFAHVTGGLVARDGGAKSLEIAGSDQVFRPASGAIEGDTLIVSSPEVKAPVAVRYAWKNSPEANLYNGAGLPAVPFRSDDW
jgi:sialate O-acetylesterase